MSMQEPQLIKTGDGSHSLFNPLLNETYHSHHGALQESLHVFIKMGLDAWLDWYPEQKSILVLEVGFGTGLNALLALQWARKNDCRLHYTTLEPYPISPALAGELNYAALLDAREDMARLHDAVWEEDVLLYDSFILHKTKQSLETITLAADQYDVVFFDAFAPSKQPELWEKHLLQKVANTMKAGGLFCTYCAKGQLKRDLKDSGLLVETLPGAPGKKEMVRAAKK
jgi:tRNA U34 5-methylaminomethyl-2-thiouridine-forming methyltransferase MnmC